VTDIEIRPIEPDEYEAAGELCVAAYAAFMDHDHDYVATLRDVKRRAEVAEVLVAVDGGRLLGTVTFVPDDGPLGEIARPDETEFRMLAVDPAAQGRGVGLALMRRIVEESRGRSGIVCSTQPVMRAAHRIYEKLGFRRDPERDWSPMPGVELLAFVLELR
jgi:GNAT superfamily N-acetyltransferase